MRLCATNLVTVMVKFSRFAQALTHPLQRVDGIDAGVADRHAGIRWKRAPPRGVKPTDDAMAFDPIQPGRFA